MRSIGILCGGLATRLRPMTETVPKALIEIAGKPFICHQLDYLAMQGFSRVVLCVGYLGEMIRDVVGQGASWDLHVSYSFDGPALLGTGGAIKKALPQLGEEFFIFYGDSYLPSEFRKVEEAFMSKQKLGLMTVLKNKNQWDKSNVIYQKNILVEYNKTINKPEMQYIDYGLGILKSSIFDQYSNKDSFDIAEVYNNLSLIGKLQGYEVYERFYEIGSYQGIEDTEQYLLKIGK